MKDEYQMKYLPSPSLMPVVDNSLFANQRDAAKLAKKK